MRVEIRMSQIRVSNLQEGMAHCMVAERQLENLFKVNTFYGYMEKLPAYARQPDFKDFIIPPSHSGMGLVLNGQVCRTAWYYLPVEHPGYIAGIVWFPNEVYDYKTMLEHRSCTQKLIRSWKLAYRRYNNVGKHNYHTFRSPQKG